MVWDRLDEERWILAAMTSILMCFLIVFMLRAIEIPPIPEKSIIEEPIVIYPENNTPDDWKPTERVNQKTVDMKPPDNRPEIFLPLFLQQNRLDRTEFLTELDPVRSLEQSDSRQDVSHTSPEITELNLRSQYRFDEVESEINPGFFNRRQSGEIRNLDYAENIYENPSMKHDFGNLPPPLPGPSFFTDQDNKIFQGDIQLEEMLDPLLNWIQRNSSPINDLAGYNMRVNQKTDLTAKTVYSERNKQYEILLAGKVEKKQITFCIIDLDNSSYYMLIDQGLKKRSSIYYEGTVRRDENGEIIDFTGKRKQTSASKAKIFEGIFWNWAQIATQSG